MSDKLFRLECKFSDKQSTTSRGSACVVSPYKGIGDSHECFHYRGISPLSVRGKVYGKVSTESIKKGTDGITCDVQRLQETEVLYRSGVCSKRNSVRVFSKW